jgi:hypothetical protein
VLRFLSSNRLLKNSIGESLRAKRSNLIHKKIKYFEIAASLTLLAMTGRTEFFRILLKTREDIRLAIGFYPDPFPG